ncbi:MAG: hypothetical protein A4E57_04456 [Syntrophorhabdaceae bacterium PtaU1.Bin034]|nr:MAG: hypothetical protein A4E57_04456 [Syntrophorhabdaceae bacterium PtaU1.Bin034]
MSTITEYHVKEDDCDRFLRRFLTKTISDGGRIDHGVNPAPGEFILTQIDQGVFHRDKGIGELGDAGDRAVRVKIGQLPSQIYH